AVPVAAGSAARLGPDACGVLILRDRGSVDIECAQGHLMQGLFVIPALRVGIAATHREIACRNGHHVARLRVAGATENRAADRTPGAAARPARIDGLPRLGLTRLGRGGSL